MSLYAISDLHLAISHTEKSMEVFGKQWNNYIERLKENWNNTISEQDTVILPGDFSWATYLDEAYADFEFLNSLNGTKILSKGNHDYWWTTSNKLFEYIKNNAFNTINFLHNNCFIYENISICGTRGWICPDSPGFSADDLKIYNRELIRLELSLKTAKTNDIVVMLHYPPLMQNGNPDEGFLNILKKYSVKICIFGHLHGNRNVWIEGVKDDIDFKLVSSDFLNFSPIKLL